MNKRKASYPEKRTMNLFYKPDRTTKPATVALYVLFVLVVLLGLSKILVYDLWQEAQAAEAELASVEQQRDSILASLTDYDQVLERYRRYAATEEEEALIDRMEILDLLDSAIGSAADVQSISISGTTVQVQFSGVTLAETAEIVRALEASPLVAGTQVNTAATTQDASADIQASVLIQLQKEAAHE